MLPVVDHEMLHTASSNVCSTVEVHSDRSALLLHTITWRSCEAVAICERGNPIDGAQATSRTQSECASSRCSSTQRSLSSRQIFTKLSQPPLTRRFTAAEREVTRWSNAGSGAWAGHHEMAFTPIVCAFGIFLASHTVLRVAGEHRYRAIRTGAGQHQSVLGWREVHRVYRGVVVAVFVAEMWQAQRLDVALFK